ncbi:uncharacterized protein LOC143620916 [Bidens hawaiensis]|uniref:uncharacterized protein LOC143620916 n=1 Tax=Bidens hawaiensis TaxID=980011 RepID=UPI0040498D7E
MPSSIDGRDGDDESNVHVARRGPASQVQVPEPMNHEWIWIEDGQFNNQKTSARIIGLNLKHMWLDAWDSWKDVSYEHRLTLFERFKCYFQWEEKWNTDILRYWEKCIAGKFPDLLNRVRMDTKEAARIQGFQVGDDFSVLEDFKPSWIRSET